MTSKRGFTLVELVFTVAITAVIVGALGGLFVFVGTRAAQTVAKNGVLLQTQALSEELDAIFSQAQSCTLVHLRGAIDGIKCTLPAVATDADADGIVDKFGTDRVGPTGREGYGFGRRVWIYMSDSTGLTSNVMASGGTVWRAWRNDDLLPTAGDIDMKFAYYYGDRNRPRWNFIHSINYSIDTKGTITYAIIATKLRRAERRADAGDAYADFEALRLSRTVVCDNWRK